MGYTWTNGEVITADKLNATGGTSYDLVMHSYFNENTLVSTLTATGLSIDEIVEKIENDEVVGALIYEEGVLDGGGNILAIANASEISCSQMTTEGVESVELTFRCPRTTLIINCNIGENTGTFELNAAQYTYTYDSATKTYTFTPSEDSGGVIDDPNPGK